MNYVSTTASSMDNVVTTLGIKSGQIGLNDSAEGPGTGAVLKSGQIGLTVRRGLRRHGSFGSGCSVELLGDVGNGGLTARSVEPSSSAPRICPRCFICRTG